MIKVTVVSIALLLAMQGYGGITQAASVGAQDNRDGRARPMLTQPVKPSGLSGGPVSDRPLTPTEKANPGLKPYPHDPINRSGHSEPRWFLVMSKPVGADSSLTRFITHFATQAECQKALQEYDNQSGYPMGCREVSTWVTDE